MAQKITLDLSVFKSSGVYTLEFDASQNIILNPQTVRLVVGYSNVGPFNTPVYLPDPATALAVFGDIDRSLEKKGSFFHRSIFTCLNVGPIFAISLLNLNNSVQTDGMTPDVANGANVARYRAFSIDTAEPNGINSDDDYTIINADLPKQDKLLSSYYNKQKFWFADPSALLATMDTTDERKLFSFVNLSQNPISLIVKKSLDSSTPIKGFDISAQEYYGNNLVPSYIHPYDYISDYFLDVIAVSGNWTDYQALSLDPLYSKYFTPKGFIKGQLNNFLALSSVNIVLSATGCIIPDFVDQNGIGQDLKVLINNQVGQTGILCAVNDEALDDLDTGNYSLIDLVGNHLIAELDGGNPLIENPNIDFLSYTSPLFSDMVYTKNTIELNDAISPNSILDECGTLFSLTGITGQYGMPTSDFSAYSPSALSGGFPYIQTNLSGANAATIIEQLTTFLTPTPELPGATFILGKVTGNVNGNLSASAAFSNNDLVKLQVQGLETVIVGGNTQLRITWSHPLFSTTNPLVSPYTDTNLGDSSYQFGLTDFFNRFEPMASPGVFEDYDYFGYESSQMYQDHENGFLSDGDVIHLNYTGTILQYVRFSKSVDRDGFNTLAMMTYSDAGFITQENSVALGESYTSIANGPSNTVNDNQVAIISLVGNLSQNVGIISQISTTKVEISSAAALSSGIAVGDLLVSTDTDLFPNPVTGIYGNRLTRINAVSSVAVPGSPGIYTVYVSTDRPILLYPGVPAEIKMFQPVANYIQTYDFTYLPGFQITAAMKPNGSDSRVDDILNVLTNTNIATSLASKDIITFRYVVDTFDGQIKANTKSQLSTLAMNRGKCLAILNAPSIQSFTNSTSPRFTDAATATNPMPMIDTAYIASGGNLSLNPPFTFSLPDEDNGAKYCGFFSPFLTIRENNNNINIPPAAHVSNNFIKKFINGEPYSIVAGQKRGIISGSNIVGLEYDYIQSDRDNLEPFGINPIIRKRGIGLVIYGNQTGYQRTNTAFNNLHVRDLLITIEGSVEDILNNYVFDFNEDSVRLEIKTLVDNYLSGVMNVGGIYNYLTIMDSSNNTPAIIDQNIGIIDVIVEPARGIQKFINRMTVTRTGGINSGGFIQFG